LICADDQFLGQWSVESHFETARLHGFMLALVKNRTPHLMSNTDSRSREGGGAKMSINKWNDTENRKKAANKNISIELLEIYVVNASTEPNEQ